MGAALKIVPWPERPRLDGRCARLSDARSRHRGAAPRALDERRPSRSASASAQACRKIGAALVLDLTQSLGALPFNVRDVQPDFAVAASYKWLLGPYSTGLDVCRAQVAQRIAARRRTGFSAPTSRDFSSLILYCDDYDAGARRFDMGERSNFALLPAAERAMQQIAGMEDRANFGNLPAR